MSGLPTNVKILDAYRPARPLSELPHETIIRALPAIFLGMYHQAQEWADELPGLPRGEDLSRVSSHVRQVETMFARLETARAMLDAGPEDAA